MRHGLAMNELLKTCLQILFHLASLIILGFTKAFLSSSLFSSLGGLLAAFLNQVIVFLAYSRQKSLSTRTKLHPSVSREIVRMVMVGDGSSAGTTCTKRTRGKARQGKCLEGFFYASRIPEAQGGFQNARGSEEHRDH